MSILKRVVPEPKGIKDYREGGGVFYEAKCDQCGRIYYPKRSTSKYCSKSCATEFLNSNKLSNTAVQKQVGEEKVTLAQKKINQGIKEKKNAIKEIDNALSGLKILKESGDEDAARQIMKLTMEKVRITSGSTKN